MVQPVELNIHREELEADSTVEPSEETNSTSLDQSGV